MCVRVCAGGLIQGCSRVKNCSWWPWWWWCVLQMSPPRSGWVIKAGRSRHLTESWDFVGSGCPLACPCHGRYVHQFPPQKNSLNSTKKQQKPESKTKIQLKNSLKQHPDPIDWIYSCSTQLKIWAKWGHCINFSNKLVVGCQHKRIFAEQLVLQNSHRKHICL